MPDQDPWLHLQRHAGNQITRDLVERVISSHRKGQLDYREAWQNIGFAFLTAVACITLVLAVVQRQAASANARNFAAWSEIAKQTSLFARLP